MISKSCQYAIRAAVYLASRVNENLKLNVKAIAKEIDAPEAFTAKTLQILNKHNIITSLKGPYGGFFIEEYQLDVPILNIVNAIDGLQIFKSCGLGLKKCSEAKPCPLHADYQSIKMQLVRLFNTKTIQNLADEMTSGDFFINNKWALLVGMAVYGLFLFFTISGNQICDCATTEKSSPNSTSNRVGVSRFYHK